MPHFGGDSGAHRAIADNKQGGNQDHVRIAESGKASFNVSVPLRTKATMTIRAIASMRTLPVANSTTAMAGGIKPKSIHRSQRFLVTSGSRHSGIKAPTTRGEIMGLRFKTHIYHAVSLAFNHQIFRAAQHEVGFIRARGIGGHVDRDSATAGRQSERSPAGASSTTAHSPAGRPSRSAPANRRPAPVCRVSPARR